MLIEKAEFLKKQIDANRLTSSQWHGILRAMDKYAEHYHAEFSNKNESDQEDVYQISFWFMTDLHLFIKAEGRTIFDIVNDLRRIAKKNPHGTVCPVIIMDKEGEELRRVGKHCYVDKDGYVEMFDWFKEVINDPAVRKHFTLG